MKYSHYGIGSAAGTLLAVTILATGAAHAQSISNNGSVSQVVAPGPLTAIAGELEIGGIGGNGDVTIDGAGTPGGSVLTVTEAGAIDPVVRVGNDNGAGLLNVQGGGVLDIDGTGGANARLEISNVFPDAPTQNGTVNITGSGSAINVTAGSGAASVFVGRGGLGALNLSSSASLTIDAQNGDAGLQIGSSGSAVLQPASEGHLSVDNSTVTITSNGADAFLNVGRKGAGALSNVSTLSVQNGSVIDLQGQSGGFAILNIGRDGAKGLATVTGASSRIDAADFVQIGRGTDGDGTLNILAGGEVDSSAGSGQVRLGRDSAKGTLNISGAGSLLDAKTVDIGRDTQGTGTANINDGGQLVAQERIRVGLLGGGTLNIGDNPATGGVETGGTATTALVTVATVAGASGTVNVTSGGTLNIVGVDSGGNGALLQVGREGTATANITGGTVTIDDQGVTTGLPGGILLGGTGSGTQGLGNGTLNIGAGGSVTSVSGFTQVGRDGSGTLNVTGGGTLDASAQTVSVVGRKAGATGSATVSGVGSTWNAGQNLFVGTDVSFSTQTAIGNGGTGTVTVANGGAITAGSVVVDAGGTLTGSGGTINGNVTVQNGGLFAPGSSPGTMIINGDLVIDTGVVQLETEGGVSDEIQVSGTVTIGQNAIIELVFDVLPAGPVDIDDFFTASVPAYDGDFDGSGILAFVTDPVFVGQNIDVFFGDLLSPVSITTQQAVAAVSAPGAIVLLLAGFASIVRLRRR